MINQESYHETEYIETLDPVKAQIIRQYMQVAGAFDEVFLAASPRMQGHTWLIDTVGLCNISKHRSEGLLSRVVNNELIDLREIRNKETASEVVTDKPVCPYHRKDKGCILGNLKSPLCLAHIDVPFEFEARFGINAQNFQDDIRDSLRQIQRGLENPSHWTTRNDPPNPSVNEEFVRDVVLAAHLLKIHIEKFPIVPRVFGLFCEDGSVDTGPQALEAGREVIKINPH